MATAGALLFYFAVIAAALMVPSSPPDGAVAVSKELNSFSIEFRDFVDFAGTQDSPNQFSVNLLQNLANRTGVMPMIRVGGSTQDDVTFLANQSEAIIVHGTTEGTERALITIGPSYYDSYGSFPSTCYIAGITLAVNGSAGNETRQSEAAGIQKSLGSNLHSFEIGNEPDLYAYWNRRPSSWDVSDYVAEWQAAQQIVIAASTGEISYSAPSFAGTDVNSTGEQLEPNTAFQHGLNSNGKIHEIFAHNYMGSASASGVSLQNTLMNHAAVVKSIAIHVELAKELKQYCACPYIMGETNSLSGGGASGLSNVFGAALWVVDYALYQATQNITRVHFHQANGSPYAAWAPQTSPATNPPYYGNLVVAGAVGSEDNVQISYFDLGNGDEYTSAYMVFANGAPVRMVILNMNQYNSDDGDNRGSQIFTLSVPGSISGAKVDRLSAPGAEVISNITLAGTSYDFSPNQGLPNVVDPDAANENVNCDNGVLSVQVMDTEGVLLHFM